jgi:hypothetical protein
VLLVGGHFSARGRGIRLRRTGGRPICHPERAKRVEGSPTIRYTALPFAFTAPAGFFAVIPIKEIEDRRRGTRRQQLIEFRAHPKEEAMNRKLMTVRHGVRRPPVIWVAAGEGSLCALCVSVVHTGEKSCIEHQETSIGFVGGLLCSFSPLPLCVERMGSSLETSPTTHPRGLKPAPTEVLKCAPCRRALQCPRAASLMQAQKKGGLPCPSIFDRSR